MLEFANQNFGAGFAPQGYRSIKIARLAMIETGTYNQPYARPYQTYVDNHTLDNIIKRVEEQPNKPITGALLAGVASNILSPSPTPQGEIGIINGWNEPRIRFYMEVHVEPNTGGSFIYFIQGYTSHLGVASTGDIDPRMEFYINSYIRVNRATQWHNGIPFVKDVITESAHIIDGQLHYQQVPQHNEIYMMRPQDIFGGIQSNYIENAYQYSQSNAGVIDTRVQLNGESVRSNRRNNLPAGYLAAVVDTYQNGIKLAEWGQGPQDIIAHSRDISLEPAVNENLFIRALCNVKGLSYNVTSFTKRDLEAIDPNVGHVTQYTQLTPAARANELHHSGQTSYWNGTDRATVAANILCNAIPALMMATFLMKIRFTSTNHDISGNMYTEILEVHSVTNADLRQNYDMFIQRFENEVMRDLTYGNQDLYSLQVVADVFGETYVTLSIGSETAMISYASPSFCDSKLTPILTNSKDNFHTVTHDLETLMTNINNIHQPSVFVNNSI